MADESKTTWTCAAYAQDAAQAERMLKLLEENGITARKQGGIRDIYATGGAFGEEIAVAPEDLDRARELLSAQAETAVSGEKKNVSRSRSLLCLAASAVLLALLLMLRRRLGG